MSSSAHSYYVRACSTLKGKHELCLPWLTKCLLIWEPVNHVTPLRADMSKISSSTMIIIAKGGVGATQTTRLATASMIVPEKRRRFLMDSTATPGQTSFCRGNRTFTIASHTCLFPPSSNDLVPCEDLGGRYATSRITSADLDMKTPQSVQPYVNSIACNPRSLLFHIHH